MSGHYTVEPGNRRWSPSAATATSSGSSTCSTGCRCFRTTPHAARRWSMAIAFMCAPANGTDDGKARTCPLSPSFIALDKHDGRLVAREDEQISSRVFHGQWSSPSLGRLDGKALVFFGGGDGVCYAFDAVTTAAASRGILNMAWSFDCNTPEHKFRDGKPIDYGDGDKREGRGNHNDGQYLGLNEIIGTPVFYKNRVYVAVGRDPVHGPKSKGGLFCIDAARSGDITADGAVWSYDDAGRSLSTVSIADGLLYMADNAGRVHCLDADTGKLYWVYDTHADIWSSTLVADGKVYIGTRRNFCVLAAGKEKKTVGRGPPRLPGAFDAGRGRRRALRRVAALPLGRPVRKIPRPCRWTVVAEKRLGIRRGGTPPAHSGRGRKDGS